MCTHTAIGIGLLKQHSIYTLSDVVVVNPKIPSRKCCELATNCLLGNPCRSMMATLQWTSCRRNCFPTKKKTSRCRKHKRTWTRNSFDFRAVAQQTHDLYPPHFERRTSRGNGPSRRHFEASLQLQTTCTKNAGLV